MRALAGQGLAPARRGRGGGGAGQLHGLGGGGWAEPLAGADVAQLALLHKLVYGEGRGRVISK